MAWLTNNSLAQQKSKEASDTAAAGSQNSAQQGMTSGQLQQFSGGGTQQPSGSMQQPASGYNAMDELERFRASQRRY